MKLYQTTIRLLATAAALCLASGAQAMILDQTMCELTLNGTWTAGATDICEVTDMELPAGEIVQVAAGTELNVAGDSVVHAADAVAMLPAAKIEVDTSAELVVVGTLTNLGIVRIDGQGIVTGTFANHGDGIVEIHGLLTNHGLLDNNALWFVKRFATLESDDTVFNHSQGTFSIIGAVTLTDGTLTNFHHLVNSGTAAVLTVEDPVIMTNSGAGASAINFGGGRIGVRGVFSNTGGARLTNDGSFIASTGKIINFMDSTIENTNGGLIANVGANSEIENRDGGVIRNHATIHNISVIENFCAGFILNSAAGVISNVIGAGQLDNFGGTILNAGTIARPPVQHACVFNP